MTVYQDHLEFQGVGFHRWELRRYEISRERVETVAPWPVGSAWFLPRFGRYAIVVTSKPGGAFGDRDEYRFTFDSPSLEEVFGTLRAAGYPVPAPGH